MLHHHSSSADMCAEDRITSTGSSSLLRGRLLHCRPRLSRQASLLHRTHLSLQSGLPSSAALPAPSWPSSQPAAPLAPCQPPPPDAPLASIRPPAIGCDSLRQADLRLSSNRHRAGQMLPSSTPPASRPRPPCLLPPQPRSRLHLLPLVIVCTTPSPPLHLPPSPAVAAVVAAAANVVVAVSHRRHHHGRHHASRQ